MQNKRYLGKFWILSSIVQNGCIVIGQRENYHPVIKALVSSNSRDIMGHKFENFVKLLIVSLHMKGNICYNR